MTQKMNILSTVVFNLRSVKWGQLPQLAHITGVPESTIKKIRSGEVKNPRINTIEALHNYFASSHAKEASHV